MTAARTERPAPETGQRSDRVCRLTVGDCVLAVLLVLFSLGALIPFAAGRGDDAGDGQFGVAVMRVSGTVVHSIPLTGHARFTLDGVEGQLVLAVEPGRIRVHSVACELGLCIKRGWLESPRQTIICVPNQMTVDIERAAQAPYAGVHAVTY